jgi:hypothetical protein
MRRMEMSWVLNRPPEVCWKVVTNFDNYAKASLSKGEWRHNPEGATRLGTTVESRRRIFGRMRTIHQYVVTEFEVNRAFGMTDKVPGFPLSPQRFTFEAVPDGTRLTRSVVVKWGRLREPALYWLLRRLWPIEAANIRKLVEAAG